MRSPIIRGSSIITVFSGVHIALGISTVFAICVLLLKVSVSSLINSGFVPQQPPRIFTPRGINSTMYFVNSFGVIL